MDFDKTFSSSYMVLKPEEVKLIDLFHVLFSRDISKRKSVDSSVMEESFRRRWLIFISLVAQKLLQMVAGPLALVGSGVEIFFNFISSNTNIRYLLLNFIRGKVVVPDKSSATYTSFVGHFDKRVELDRSITPRDGCRYYAALSAMASKLAYENAACIKSVVEDQWKMMYLGFNDYWNDYQEKATTQAFMFSDKTSDQETIVVAFRGTEVFDSNAWCSDFDITWYELPNVGKIHGGFMKALGLQKGYGWPREAKPNPGRLAPLAYHSIRDTLRDLLGQNEQAKFILTGHSQGGALAILFVAALIMHEENMLLKRLEGVYTFGQPRVGDAAFGEFMEKKLEEYSVKYFRFVYSNDIVPRLPYDDQDLMFKHFGTCIYYDRHYKGKVVPEEPNKNYFSLRGMLLMMINAVLELIRSFTIGYWKGPEYKEGWLLRVARVMGLIFPGIPNHMPLDYVNATRLCSTDVFLLPRDVHIE